jgi:hypothetical protein
MKVCVSDTITQVSTTNHVPNLITYLNWTPILEWHVVWCGSKNRYQKDMCLKESGLCTHNIISIVGPIINMIKGTYITTS